MKNECRKGDHVNVRFFDLFGGVGGFRHGLEKANHSNSQRWRETRIQADTRTGNNVSSENKHAPLLHQTTHGNQSGREQPQEKWECERQDVHPESQWKEACDVSSQQLESQSRQEGNQETPPERHSACPSSKGRKNTSKFRCVGYCDFDKHSVTTYNKNFKESHEPRDATEIDWKREPDFDLLCAGFPCQSFSVAGKRRGFNDTRGTLFFEICRASRIKRPKWLFLENVKGLLSHDQGKTFATILDSLQELGYFVEWQVLDSQDFGVPQHRERVFIIGHLGGIPKRTVFPLREDGRQALGKEREEGVEQIAQAMMARDYPNWGGNFVEVPEKAGCLTGGGHSGGLHSDMTIIPVPTPDKHGIIIEGNIFPSGHEAGNIHNPQGISPTLRPMGPRGSCKIQAPKIIHNVYGGFGEKEPRVFEDVSPTIRTPQGGGHLPMVASETRIRRLTPIECERLQGFPIGWTEGVSDTQRYKQMGNAVTVNVIEAIAVELAEAIQEEGGR